ncbi:choice-of-anchor D domain-containing protein [Granulicella sp. WH15]|uniref:choice-of-anchor D domain-containing protein n=1 Tax=Granulicella sp. WH15 TaxID=2602070 RepID=UPI001366932A|nr:choice-of-anchor D domain-containing protein [Granulicella sp. WH15]QHN04823.1 choice-of-anchor D domain-containing protein [Granulicella sp. WH15]
MVRAVRLLPAFAVLALSFLISSCGGGSSSGTTPPPVTTPPTPATQHGTVFGGTIPVIGATIQLYAVGTTGDGSAATPLLNPAVTSDSNGSFTMQGSEACPSASALVYLVATGGNPGLASGTNNKALSMMAAIGPCSSLTPSANFVINELTTVAAVAALEPYFTSPTAIGTSPANSADLTSAFTLAAAFANPTTGVTPGAAVPAGDTVPVEQINTLADILATCIDTTGGAAGDSTPCGDLLTLATPSGATAPATTLTALLNIAKNPTLNVASLFHLASDSGPFQPIPAQAPLNWTVRLQVPSTLKITPTAGLSFAATPVSTTAPTQAVTLTNTGTSAIALTSLSLAGINAADFAQTSNCTASLQPQATCTATVGFTPTAAGSRSAYLVVTSNAPNSPQPILLTGTATASAPAITLSPASLTFTSQTIGFTSAAQAITLTNSGTGTLNLSSITLAGANAADYTLANSCSATLATSAHCTFSVTFKPTAAGTRTATITIVSNATSSPNTILLTGTGIAPSFSLSSGELNFYTLVGSTSPAQTVTLTNTSTGILNIASITLTGANAADYILVNACPATLAASAHCTYSVTFKPSSIGTRTATLSIISNASSAPFTIPLTGVGTTAAISLSAASLTFASQTIGSASPAQTVTLTNSGTGTLNLTSITLAGANATDYSLVNACPATLAASAHCTFTVAFKPIAAGTRTAAVSIVSNATSSPNTIALTGTGTTSAISLSPTSITFASQPVGSTSAAQTVTLTNSGTGALNLTGITLSGANAADYSLANACPASLAASAHCTFTVAFNPTAAGTRTAAVTIASNAPAASTIPLTGSGTATIPPPPSSITLSTNSLAFTNYAVSFNATGYAQPTITGNTVTVTNSGSAPLLISAINISPSFYQTNNCGSELLGQSVCTITVWPIEVPAAPSTTATSYTGTLTLVSNDPTAPSTVALSNTVNVPATANDFGTWAVGMPSNAPLMIEGNLSIGYIGSFTAIMTGPDSADFPASTTPDSQCGVPMVGCNEQVIFQPTTTGKRLSVYVVLAPGDYGGSFSIREVHVLSGAGQEAGPSFSLTPQSPVQVNKGSAPASDTLTLSNNGTTSLDLSQLSSSTTDAVITGSTCGKVAIAATCTVNITYSSSVTGTHTVTFSSMDAISGKTLTASFNAMVYYLPPSVSPNSLSFPPTHLGATTSQTFSVTSPDSHPLTVAIGPPASCFGSCSAAFIFPTATCNSGTCTFTATYAPTVSSPSGGFDSGDIRVTDTVSSEFVDIHLSGSPGIPIFSFSPSSLNFPSRPMGSMSTPQSIKLSNTGDATLNMSSISLTGANAADYVLTNASNCLELVANSYCTLTVAFNPTAAGTRTAAISFNTGATTSVGTLPLTGEATDPSITSDSTTLNPAGFASIRTP